MSQVVTPSADYLTSGNAGATSAAADTTIVSAPGAGISLYIYAIFVSNDSPTYTNLAIKDDTTTKFTPGIAPNGGGFVLQLTKPWKLTANKALNVRLGNALASGSINVTAFYQTGP